MNSTPVDYDDLYYTDAHIFVLGNEPFTGIAESRYPNGDLRFRAPFKNGGQHGITEEFFPSGGKRNLTPYANGAPHGHVVEWYEDGTIKTESDVEFGILIRRLDYDTSGNLVDEYNRPDDDPMMDIIKSRRQSE